MFRRISSRGSSSQTVARMSYHEPRESSLRDAEVRACEWPCDTFMNNTGIRQEFMQFVENVELSNFLSDKCTQYHHLTNSFVQIFEFIPNCTRPRCLLRLYDNSYHLYLDEFCHACKIAFWGSLKEPQKSDVESFLRSICNGENRVNKTLVPTVLLT